MSSSSSEEEEDERERERISRSAAEGGREARCVRKGEKSPELEAEWRRVVKVVAVVVRSIFEMRERSAGVGWG